MLDELQNWSIPEIIAVAMAIAYLLLAIRENIWCWLCAGVSAAIYIWLFAAANLYMESLLNVFYFAMAIYGWKIWSGGFDAAHLRPVVVWPFRIHAIAAAVIVLLSAISGVLLQKFTDAAFPYVDSATTFAAVWATFLVARKVLENWWYWLVIDLASIFIYWSRDLQLTTLLFAIYVLLIPIGLISWTGSLRRQQQAAAA